MDTVHALDEELPAVAIDQTVQKAQIHGDQLKLGEACGATAATKEGKLEKRSTKGQWQTRYVASVVDSFRVCRLEEAKKTY